jgi:hypothetical protein
MSDRELLEMYIRDINLLLENINQGDIDVYQFYEEIVHMNEFFKNQIKNDL